MREEATKLLGKRKLTISMERPPLTESAQRAIDWAFDKKLKSGQFLLNLWTFCCLLVGSHSFYMFREGMLLQAQAIRIGQLVKTLNLVGLSSNLCSIIVVKFIWYWVTY